MSVFTEGKKKRGKRGRRDNPTLRIHNLSIIAPTNVRARLTLGIED